MDTWTLDLTFGQWLTQTRVGLKLRSSDCARAGGLYQQQWSDYENDRSRRKDGQPTIPSLKTVRAIAKGLGLPDRDVLDALAESGIDTLDYERTLSSENEERREEEASQGFAPVPFSRLPSQIEWAVILAIKHDVEEIKSLLRQLIEQENILYQDQSPQLPVSLPNFGADSEEIRGDEQRKKIDTKNRELIKKLLAEEATPAPEVELKNP